MLLKYPGGKGRTITKLCQLFPHYDSFREPFAGNVPTLWHVPSIKPRWVNDLSVPVINYLSCLRDDESLIATLIAIGKLGPTETYDRFVDARWRLKEIRKLRLNQIRDRVTLAADFVVITRIAYRQKMGLHRPNIATYDPKHAPDLKTLTETRLRKARAILQGVRITSMDYSKVLLAPLGEGLTFSFIDPPYNVNATQSHLYDHLMTQEEHTLLRDRLAELDPTKHKFLMTIEDGLFANMLYDQEPFFCQRMAYTTINNHRASDLIVTNYPL